VGPCQFKKELVDADIDLDTAAGLDVINRVISAGVDPRQFAREIVEYLRSVMLVKLGDAAQSLNLPEDTLAAIEEQAARADAATIVRATERFNTAQIDLKSGLLAIPQLPLELAFIQVASPEVEPRPTAVEPLSAGLITPAVSAELKAAPAFVPPPAPAPAPAPGPAPATVGASSISVEVVMSCFEHVIATIEPRSKPMAEALRRAQLHRVEENEIYFVTFDFMKQRFDKPQPRAAIDEAFSQALGRNVSVRFVSDSEASGTAVSPDSAGSVADGEQDADDNTDALLKMATEELGGEIAD